MREFLRIFSVLSFLGLIVLSQRLCDENPPVKNVTECCPSLPRAIDKMLNEACIAKYGKNTKKQLEMIAGDIPRGNCVIECIANQTRIYKGNGQLDPINLKRLFMNSVSGYRDWGHIAARAVDLCVNETRIIFKNYKFSRKKSFSGEVVCHPVSGYVFGCLQTELFIRCPNMTQTAECDNLQTYASNCHLGVKYTK